MDLVLGKRKYRDREIIRHSPLRANRRKTKHLNGDELAIFRRAFEAKFKPLDDKPSVKTQDNNGSFSSGGRSLSNTPEQSDWQEFEEIHREEGEEEEQVASGPVECIVHGGGRTSETLSKAEVRAFMNSKPPSSVNTKTALNNKAFEDDEDEDDEKLNLKNDLALQRLINESHILDEAKSQGSLSGHRQKLIDKRMQTLGSKSSILEQQRMPMSHRKGITAKASARESKRRQEAKKNGVILERATNSRTSTNAKVRVRGVGGPAVGKFKGGTLKLSKKDVAEIKGQPAMRSMIQTRGKRAHL